MFWKIVILKAFVNFTGKILYRSHFYHEVPGLAQGNRAQLLSFDFWKVFKNNFLTKNPRVAASVLETKFFWKFLLVSLFWDLNKSLNVQVAII